MSVKIATRKAPATRIHQSIKECLCICDKEARISSKIFMQGWIILQREAKDIIVERLASPADDLQFRVTIVKIENGEKAHLLVVALGSSEVGVLKCSSVAKANTPILNLFKVTTFIKPEYLWRWWLHNI